MSDLDRVTNEYLHNIIKRKQKHLIIKWFESKGIKPELDYDDYPIITKEMIKKALGAESVTLDKKRKRGNRAALKEAMGIN